MSNNKGNIRHFTHKESDRTTATERRKARREPNREKTMARLKTKAAHRRIYKGTAVASGDQGQFHQLLLLMLLPQILNKHKEKHNRKRKWHAKGERATAMEDLKKAMTTKEKEKGKEAKKQTKVKGQEKRRKLSREEKNLYTVGCEELPDDVGCLVEVGLSVCSEIHMKWFAIFRGSC